MSWIIALVEHTLDRQHANGAFDAFSPNEQNLGPTLGLVYGLAETMRQIREEVPPTLYTRFLNSIRKAADFALAREEDHAFISNHLALFALAFLDAHEWLGDAKYEKRAAEIVNRILDKQSSDGYYLEYEGADPGYESLGIFYLATYWKRTGSPKLLDSLRRCIEFYSYFVQPDGSIGGVYGSRHTMLYFPGGFEILASKIPLARATANFMRDRIGRRNVVTPSVSDTENLIPLAYAYLEASLVADSGCDLPAPRLPCQSTERMRHFPDADIAVVNTEHYYAVVNASKGGVCRIFNKHSECVAYEDAGYLLFGRKRCWTSQRIGLGRSVGSIDKNEIHCTTSLAEVQQALPSPLKFIILRLLNLTLFRNVTMGNWLRRLIVKQLILTKRLSRLRLRRSITFEEKTVRFHDRLEAGKGGRFERIVLPRAFTAIHMGSAKYFHPSQLEETAQAPVSDMVRELNDHQVAECQFSLHFSDAGGHEMEVITPTMSGTDKE